MATLSPFEPLEKTSEASNLLEKFHDGQPIKITEQYGNASKSYVCVTEDQLNLVVSSCFDRQKASAESFYAFLEKQVVYDGLIFGLTRDLLSRAKESPTIENKLSYLLYFHFWHGGFKIENVTPNLDHYSKYPFNLI